MPPICTSGIRSEPAAAHVRVMSGRTVPSAIAARWLHGAMTDSGHPIDPIDFSGPGFAEKVVAIEWWSDGDVSMATVEFTDGEIESLPMTRGEAQAQADRCFGNDQIPDVSKNASSYRWTRMPHSD